MTDEKLSKDKHFAVFLYHHENDRGRMLQTDKEGHHKTENAQEHIISISSNISSSIKCQLLHQYNGNFLPSITHLCLPASFASIVPEGSDTLEVPAWICHLKLKYK